MQIKLEAVEGCWDAIKKVKERGAPAIGNAAVYRDVTPKWFVTGIFSETGMVHAPYTKSINRLIEVENETRERTNPDCGIWTEISRQ